MLVWLFASVLIVVYVFGLGLTVRWLVGAPVGLMRCLVTGVIGFFVIVPALFALLGRSGILDLESIGNEDSPPPEVILVGAVAALWVLALSAAFLAGLEYLSPSHRRVGIVARARRGRDRLRRTIRYLQILHVGVRHGLGPLLRGQYVTGAEIGPPLVAALTDAGVTFVKLGQVLATRRDIVPPELAQHLATLQTQVAPEPWESMEDVLTRSLGRTIGEVFTSIDTVPLASASIGQVHAATLATGEEVIVKVQRPGARAQVETDIDIALRICRRLEHRSAFARRIHATRLMDELATSLRGELDYRLEARNHSLMAGAAAKRRGGLRIPRLHGALITRHTLMIERVKGVPLSSAGSVLRTLSPGLRQRLAGALVDGVLEQILIDGVFHADLHPGNIMLAREGVLSLIDFGAVGILSREQRESLAALLAAFEAGDARSAVIAIRHLTLRGDVRDSADLIREVGELFTVAAIERDTTALSDRLLRLLSRQGLAFPGSLAAALRTMATLQEAVELLDSSADYADLILERVPRIAARQIDPAQGQKALLAQGLTLAQLARRIPEVVDTVTSAYAVHVVSRRTAEREARSWRLRTIAALGGCALAVCLAGGALALTLSGAGPALAPGVSFLGLAGATIGALALIIGTRSAVVLKRLVTPSASAGA